MDKTVLNKEFLGSYLRFPTVNIPTLYNKWAKSDPNHFGKVHEKLPGVRCLRQDPFECLICFIISSNNNIKRIQSLVIKLREKYGKTIEGTKEIAFPSIQELEKASE